MAIFKNRAGIFLALVILLPVVLILSVGVGAVNIPVPAIIRIIISPVAETASEGISTAWHNIILKLRLPRTLTALLVGAALSLAGGTMQGLFKNPLADPYIIGVSSGAAVGAALAILLGLGWGNGGALLLPLFAFAGAILSLVLVYSLAAGEAGRLPTLNLLLAGVAVSTFLGAILSVMMFFSGNQLQQVVFWLMGGFGGRGWIHLGAMLPYVVISGAVILVHGKELDALAMGEEQAYYMGVDVERVKRRLLWSGALLASAAVSVSGIIGFVGLVVPHAMRLLGGPNHRYLLPASALAGAVFLLGADILSRVVMAPLELPVGLVTALLGGPFFLYLLKKRRAL